MAGRNGRNWDGHDLVEVFIGAPYDRINWFVTPLYASSSPCATYSTVHHGPNPLRPGLAPSGIVSVPVPVAELALNFSPMPRIAPPPFGNEIDGGVTAGPAPLSAVADGGVTPAEAAVLGSASFDTTLVPLGLSWHNCQS